MNEKTLGEKLVRTDFNVTQNNDVDKFKQTSADLINLCDSLKARDPRLAALAITAFETAAMWAVKLATAEPVQEQA